jgi:hypothetical protein
MFRTFGLKTTDHLLTLWYETPSHQRKKNSPYCYELLGSKVTINVSGTYIRRLLYYFFGQPPHIARPYGSGYASFLG